MTTTQDAPKLEALAENLRKQIAADGTLTLAEGELLGADAEALVHSFLPGYTLAVSGATVAVADDGVHISGRSALPVIGDLAADITLTMGNGLEMMLSLAALPGAAMSLAQVLGYLLPGNDALPALIVSKLSLTIDTAQRSAAAHAAVEGNWSVEVGATTLALRSMALELSHADGVTSGMLTGVADFAGAMLVVTAAHAAGQWIFAAAQQQDTSLQLAAIAQALAGATLPAEVPDVALDGVALKITPGSGAFSFAARSATTWNLPIGIPNLSVTADVTAERAAAEGGQSSAPVNFSVAVGAPGPFSVIDGLDLSDIALSFAHVDGRWILTGGLGAALFERPVTLQASLEDSADERVIALAGAFTSDAPLITFADGALHGSEITLVITKPKAARGAAPAAASWSLSATGGITVGEFFDSRGTLKVERTPDGSSFVFVSDTAQAHMPVPMPNIAPDPQIALALRRIAITRVRAATGLPAAWSFGIEASAGFAGWPSVVSKLLPQEPIAATLDVDPERIKLTINRFTGPLTLPDITISGTTIELGASALDMSDFSLIIGRANGAVSASSIALDATIGIGLPAELNYMFGSSDDGQPAIRFFRTYVEGDPDSLIKVRLGITPQGLTAALQTSPISDEFIRTTYDKASDTLRCDVDMGDFGAFWFNMPKLVCNGADFAASGAFEIVRPLQLPLTPLRVLLKACKLDTLAARIPAALSLKEFDLRGVLRDIGRALPNDVAEPINAIADAIDKLPDRLAGYTTITTPKSLAFDIAVTASGGARFDIQTDPATPIRVLYPVLNPLNPMLAGITLSRLSFGELFGGTLFDLRMNAQIDMFDLVPLGTALLLDALGVSTDARPDTHALGRSLVIDDLRMGLVYETGVPVPVLLFFKELALHHLGAEGTEIQSRWSFPQPELSLDLLKTLVQQFSAFFRDPEARLATDNALGDAIKLTIGANYLRLPKYLHGDLIGKDGTVAELSAYALVAGLLNGLKDAGTGALIEQIPLDVRSNTAAAALGPMNVQAQWLLTTPKEYREGSYRRLNMDASASNQALALIPVNQRDERGLIVFGHGQAALAGAGLEATLALAATNAQFRTFLRTRGRIGNALDIELQGSISAPKRDRAFSMSGTSAMRVFGHDLLTGSVDVSDQSFTIAGNFDLFPGTPLRVTGSMNGQISANDFMLAGAGSIGLGNWLALSGQATLDRSGITLGSTWNGMTARFSAQADGAQFRTVLDIADAFNAQLIVGGGQEWVRAPMPLTPPLSPVAQAEAEVSSARQSVGQIQGQIATISQQIANFRSQMQLVALQTALQAAQARLAVAQQALAAARSLPPAPVVVVMPEVISGPVQPWTGQTISASVRLQGKWVRDLALASAQRIKQQADQAAAAIEPARRTVAAGSVKVLEFDRKIAARREVVQRAYNDATARIRNAENEVNSKQAEVNRLQGEIDWRNRDISAAQRALDNDKTMFFTNPRRFAELSAKIVKLGSEVAGLEIAKRTAIGALTLAQQALAQVRATVKVVPPELDPELTGLITARGATNAGLIAAQGTLQAAQQTLGVLGSVPAYLGGATLDSLVVIDQASFSGTLDVVQGGTVTMSMTTRLMGAGPQTYSVSFSFGSPLAAAQELAERLAPDAAGAIARAQQIISAMPRIPNL